MQNALRGKLSSSRGGAIALGIGAALLAGILLLVYLNRYTSSVDAANEPTPVLVAKNLIAVGTSGTVIANKDLYQSASIPKEDVKVGAIADPAYLNGRVALVDIFPGQQITTADLSAGTTDALPTKITGKERAVAIPVDEARGLVGHVANGDHVDIYLGIGSQEGGLLTLLAPNISILVAPGTQTDTQSAANSSNIVVLKAPARVAQRLAFASDAGDLWFLLRPQAGAKNPPPKTITIQDLLRLANAQR